MTRQEVLNGLNNAIKLFEKREAIRAEYKQVQNQDRGYKRKKKIGFLGIIILGFELYYFVQYMAGFFILLLANDQENIEMKTPTVILLISIVVIITTFLFFRMRNIQKNKQIDKDNIEIKKLKLAIQSRKKELDGQYANVQELINKYLGDWYPQGYDNSDAAAYFYQVIQNGRANTLGDAINLYEEECYRMEQRQQSQEIISQLESQNRKQNIQIAQSAVETASLNAQLSKTNKQLENIKKEMAELKKKK